MSPTSLFVTLGLSIAVNFGLVLFLRWGTLRLSVWNKHVDEIIARNKEQGLEIFTLQAKLAAAEVKLAFKEEDKKGSMLLLDEQTKGLIRLAISNPSPSEASAAAFIVCKRLKEKLDER
jgi:hypothetical protein